MFYRSETTHTPPNTDSGFKAGANKLYDEGGAQNQ